LLALFLFSESSSSSVVARWLELLWFETNIGTHARRKKGAGLLIVKPLLDFSDGGPS
jgi:hypothetical protein